MLYFAYTFFTKRSMDLILIKPEINAQAIPAELIITKLIIQLAVNDLDTILKITKPLINTAKAKSNLTLTLNLKIRQAK